MRPQGRPSFTGRPGTETGGSSAQGRPSLPTQFVNFSFFKVDPAWRRLSESEQEKGKQEFAAVVKEYQGKPGTFVLSYSLVGIRSDAELMLWRIANDLETFQKMTSELMKTGLGKYLEITYSYLSLTKRSVYVDKMDPEHQNPRTHIIPGRSKYLFIYPFVKTRDWYQLSFPARQGMMDEHIQVGSKYPSVKLNTTYSFGIDDQEFVVAFETDDPKDFLNLVQELRETEASRYTLRDVPMFTCIRHDDVLDALHTL
ncbi:MULTISPECIES: chlorite dismutase family protein [Thermoactinomyces]|jgi:chlorite dismutase|uniref:Coproheme decarboxylase n=1 Tax=Thermoactinomyces daqus TaxID=1329516 RepID=A0A7W1X8J5_9BACL|nr:MULTISPECIES: chlorite dismutase family protein [Thermoactinomyces]MBA4542073.1 chlorite dismutase family protein [Thermoactinomyces daqus]MBH8598914.1 chlorite dismutase family protein [Thermoactinomyces sp. CICC 10523]MBH8604900.1 chlorite dismutase family protein [Thermoactinomyces sp. CICC 10522]MBH8608384.1 chlorite dismutase family protein [Thermoactinomyces sp. CICC 10521]